MRRFFLFALILLTSLGKKSKRTSEERLREKVVEQKKERLEKYINEDEGHLLEPYLGGYNSQDSAMLVVTFHSFEEIRKTINPRWRAIREMVEDIQKMLLTGGVKTNIFRERVNGDFVFVMNDL